MKAGCAVVKFVRTDASRDKWRHDVTCVASQWSHPGEVVDFCELWVVSGSVALSSDRIFTSVTRSTCVDLRGMRDVRVVVESRASPPSLRVSWSASTLPLSPVLEDVPKTEAMETDDMQRAWSTHDGQMFADEVFANAPRCPTSSAFCRLHSQTGETVRVSDYHLLDM